MDGRPEEMQGCNATIEGVVMMNDYLLFLYLPAQQQNHWRIYMYYKILLYKVYIHKYVCIFVVTYTKELYPYHNSYWSNIVYYFLEIKIPVIQILYIHTKQPTLQNQYK